MKKVLLIDDHSLVRAGMRYLVEDLDDYEVVAEGSDGAEAMDLIKAHCPDILVMDIDMPKVSGLEILPRIHATYPELPVILLSMHASKDYLQRSFACGARGYLLKDSAEIELELAFKAVMNGEGYVSPKLSVQFIEALSTPEPSVPDADTLLTKRQKQILTLLASGQTTKQIAYDLNLSKKTVETHRAQIMERVGLRDLASLTRYAIKANLISLDDH